MQFIHIKIKCNFITADMTCKILIKIMSNIFERRSKEVTFKSLCCPCLCFSFFPDFNFPLFKLMLTSFLLFLHFPRKSCQENHYTRAERSMYGSWRTGKRKVCWELEQKPRTSFISVWVELTDLGCFALFSFLLRLLYIICEQYFILPEIIILIFQKIILCGNTPCM